MLQLILQQLLLGLKSCVLEEKHAPVTHGMTGSLARALGLLNPQRQTQPRAGVPQAQEVKSFPLGNRETTNRIFKIGHKITGVIAQDLRHMGMQVTFMIPFVSSGMEYLTSTFL